MDCKKWQEIASDYIEGTLPRETMATAKAHIASCAACSRDEMLLRGLYREMSAVPSVEPSLYFRDNVMTAIERGERNKTLFLPRLLGITTGTLVAAGAVSAFLWTVLVPHPKMGDHPTVSTESKVIISPLNTPLPGSANLPAEQDEPRLRVSRTTTLLPDDTTACDISLILENANEASAKIALFGGGRADRVMLNRGVPQIVRVPISAARGSDTFALLVSWVAEGHSHDKVLIVPVAAVPTETAANQSFGLGNEPIVDAAREIAARYHRPITLEDVPTDLRVEITAKRETALQTLRRNLSFTRLHITESQGGLLIEPTSTIR